MNDKDKPTPKPPEPTPVPVINPNPSDLLINTVERGIKPDKIVKK